MNFESKVKRIDRVLKKWVKDEYDTSMKPYCYIERMEKSFLYDFDGLVTIHVMWGFQTKDKDGTDAYKGYDVHMTILADKSPKFIAGMIVEKILEDDLNNGEKSNAYHN
jgi:hypothetical protein